MGKTIGIFLSIVMALSLVGCGPTMNQLKTENAGVYTFERDMKYTEVYHLTCEWAASRFSSYTIGKHTVGLCGWGVAHDLYPEAKFGQVGVAFQDIFTGPDFYLNIQIDSERENRTRIQTYYRYKSWEADAKNLENYIDGVRTTTR